MLVAAQAALAINLLESDLWVLPGVGLWALAAWFFLRAVFGFHEPSFALPRISAAKIWAAARKTGVFLLKAFLWTMLLAALAGFAWLMINYWILVVAFLGCCFVAMSIFAPTSPPKRPDAATVFIVGAVTGYAVHGLLDHKTDVIDEKSRD